MNMHGACVLCRLLREYAQLHTCVGKMDQYIDGAACQFVSVIDMDYMVYLNFFGCVMMPLLIMFAIYIYIYSVVRMQIRQIAAMTVPAITTNSSATANRQQAVLADDVGQQNGTLGN